MIYDSMVYDDYDSDYDSDSDLNLIMIYYDLEILKYDIRCKRYDTIVTPWPFEFGPVHKRKPTAAPAPNCCCSLLRVATPNNNCTVFENN